ncbi:SRPBCC family protein [Allokutzneria albata]|uniref:Polyketide cyclase / dehydrase and lipid transport n=1 Tax=Allokutzneria albata TaxID=211114 RepID=A0A1G9TSQ9_ALLAB|nr:SRPBCC family protein [Allokutzneria albata]SDM50484.1 Polyketide cyclase / dehydrase and lipid transport [Allokutzneria albata]
MTAIRLEVQLDLDADSAWEVIGDFAAGPARMAPGFVAKSLRDKDSPDLREVTFTNGLVVRERLVTRDDERRRIDYGVIGGTVTPEHDDAALQVFPDGERSRLVWTRDVRPAELADQFRAAMEEGIQVIARTLRAQPSS